MIFLGSLYSLNNATKCIHTSYKLESSWINEDQIWKMIQNSAENDYTLQIIEYEVPRELEKSEDFLEAPNTLV